MKSLAIILLAFFANWNFVYAQKSSLDVEGTILFENRTLQGALVTVIRDGKPFTSFLTDIDGGYNLYLPMGSEFVITISKKNYVKKMYTVSTAGVSNESALKKFPVIVADVELLKHYEGVDYSLFNQPINKYYFNPKKDNFEYDKAYLKHMLALVNEFKKNEKNAIELALLKIEQAKKDSALAKFAAIKIEEKAPEISVVETKTIEPIIVAKEEKPVVEKPVLTADVKPKPLNDKTMVKIVKSDNLLALLAKYKPGITEEIIPGINVVVIQRVVVRDEMAWVYQKKLFSWGGVACFRDGAPISESAFDHETKKQI